MDVNALRSHFPVLERVAYLNAGTNGPLATEATEAAKAELERELAEGRFTAAFERRFFLQGELRAGLARLLGGVPDTDVALTTGTSEGLGKVIAGLGLEPGDEIVSSDSEHPGLLGPLRAARERGVTIRLVPLAEAASAVGPNTRLVAVSHVGWVSGEVAPVEQLAALDVPVLYDGAQGIGAVEVDVRALNAAAYAGSGQKWLCGSEATGCLYVSPTLQERLACVSPSYTSFSRDQPAGIDAPLAPGAARHDSPVFSAAAIAATLASVTLLERESGAAGRARAHAMAARFAETLREAGRETAPRGDTTLVAWRSPDPDVELARTSDAGIVIRQIPGRGLLRASVGPWTSDEDLERLLGAI